MFSRGFSQKPSPPRLMEWTTSGSRSLLCVLPARERPLLDKGSPSVELVLTQSSRWDEILKMKNFIIFNSSFSSPVSPEDLQHRPTSHLQYLCRHGHNIKFPTGGRSSSSSSPPSTAATGLQLPDTAQPPPHLHHQHPCQPPRHHPRSYSPPPRHARSRSPSSPVSRPPEPALSQQ